MTLPREVDVLVAGFGPAGACAAIAAQDAGASVLIREKTSAGGGNCPHSGGFLFEVAGPRAIDHLDALCIGKTDLTVLQAYAAGLPEVAGSGLWRVLESAVRARGIHLALGSPVLDLVMDNQRPCGATVRHQGATVQVAARRGIVLASGSFEADAGLRDAYLPLPLVSVGDQGNTGDTIALARAAGAALWHMSAFSAGSRSYSPAFPPRSRSTCTRRALSCSTATYNGSPTRPAGSCTTGCGR